MIEKIKKVCSELAEDFANKIPFTQMNSNEYRKNLRDKLSLELEGCTIVCDETNNFNEVIDLNCLVIKFQWMENNQPKYLNSIFGSDYSVNLLSSKYNF